MPRSRSSGSSSASPSRFSARSYADGPAWLRISGDAPARKGDGFTIPNCVELLAEFERMAGGVVDRAALA